MPGHDIRMHAIEVSETGGSEILSYAQAPQPTPGRGEVLIKAEAIGVNFIDTYLRSGQYPREVPFILGTEVCGTRPRGPAGPQDSRLCCAASVSQAAQRRVGSAITESTANAQNTTAR